MADPDLTNIDAVTVEMRNVRAQQQKIVSYTTNLLKQGIMNENVAQTTTALQVSNINVGYNNFVLYFIF